MRWMGGGEEKKGWGVLSSVWDRLSLEGNQSSLGFRRLQGGGGGAMHAHTRTCTCIQTHIESSPLLTSSVSIFF